MQFLRPVKYIVWGWQAVINFYIVGMASGMYLISLMAGFLQSGPEHFFEPLTVRLLSPVLVCIGFITVAFEAGHPSRAAYLLRNLKISWMSRETAAGIFFIVFGTLDALFTSPVFVSIAGAAALGLIVSQGFVVFRSVAVRSWNMPLIPALFLTSGLWSGCGLILLARTLAGQPLGRAAFAMFSAVALLDFLVWSVYRYRNQTFGYGNENRSVLLPLLYSPSTLIGYFVPMAIVVVLISLADTGTNGPFIPAVTLIAGFAIIAGALLQKTEIILGSNYLRAVQTGKPLMRKP